MRTRKGRGFLVGALILLLAACAALYFLLQKPASPSFSAGQIVKVEGTPVRCGEVIEYRRGHHLVLRDFGGAQTYIQLAAGEKIVLLAESLAAYGQLKKERFLRAIQHLAGRDFQRAQSLLGEMLEVEGGITCCTFFSGICKMALVGESRLPNHPLLDAALDDFSRVESDPRPECADLLGFSFQQILEPVPAFNLVSFYLGLIHSLHDEIPAAKRYFRQINRLSSTDSVMNTLELEEAVQDLALEEKWDLLQKALSLTLQALASARQESGAIRL